MGLLCWINLEYITSEILVWFKPTVYPKLIASGLKTKRSQCCFSFQVRKKTRLKSTKDNNLTPKNSLKLQYEQSLHTISSIPRSTQSFIQTCLDYLLQGCSLSHSNSVCCLSFNSVSSNSKRNKTYHSNTMIGI